MIPGERVEVNQILAGCQQGYGELMYHWCGSDKYRDKIPGLPTYEFFDRVGDIIKVKVTGGLYDQIVLNYHRTDVRILLGNHS